MANRKQQQLLKDLVQDGLVLDPPTNPERISGTTVSFQSALMHTCKAAGLRVIQAKDGYFVYDGAKVMMELHLESRSAETERSIYGIVFPPNGS